MFLQIIALVGIELARKSKLLADIRSAGNRAVVLDGIDAQVRIGRHRKQRRLRRHDIRIRLHRSAVGGDVALLQRLGRAAAEKRSVGRTVEIVVLRSCRCRRIKVRMGEKHRILADVLVDRMPLADIGEVAVHQHSCRIPA